MEALGMHRQEALTREAVCHTSPLAYIVGSHGFLKEASTCRIEVAGYVAFYHPLVVTWSGQPITYVGDGVICASIWPESVGVNAKVCFPYWFQDHTETFLYNSVPDGWSA